MKDSICIKRKQELDIPEIKGKNLRYWAIKNGEIFREGKSVIERAYIDFPYQKLIVKYPNNLNVPVAEIYSNYKGFLLGDKQEANFFGGDLFSWQLEEPLLDIKLIERKVKIQAFIWSLYFLKKKVICLFKRISPILIFLLKCITLALILKLIL